MKENYTAWYIDFNDFFKQKTEQEKLEFLVRFAVLAPSSHNSQPWEFEIRDNTIVIKPNYKRALPISDSNYRQLFISLGCALENLLVAADYYGFETRLTYVNKSIEIALTYSNKVKSPPASHLVFSIPQRHTNRNKYESTPLPENFLKRAQSYTTQDVQIHFVEEQTIREAVADVVIAAGIAAMESTGFRKELSQHVKSNLTRSNVGMPAFGMGIPTPLSLVTSFLLSYVNVNKVFRKQEADLLKKHTPMFGVISTRGDIPESWIKAGQLYEKIALEAEQRNIRITPMAAVIQIGKYYKTIQKIIQTDFRPQIFFRLGYCKKITRHSPRLTAEEVIL